MNPEFSRRARGFPVYAAIRSLGRAGVADLVERCCAHAQRFGDGLAVVPSAEVLNDIVLNKVLVRFLDDGGDHDAHPGLELGHHQRRLERSLLAIERAAAEVRLSRR